MARFEPACERIRGSLWRYIDRELSAPDLAEISAHLKACGDCSRVFEVRARDAKIYRNAYVDSPFGEAFVERFKARLGREPAPALGPARAGRPFPAAVLSHPRKLLGRAALVAALLVIAVTVIFGLRPDAPLGTVKVRGSLAMVRDGKALAFPAGDLRPGDSFTLEREGDAVEFALKDGSRLGLEGPAGFRVEEGSRAGGRFLARLQEGVLLAEVAHRGQGREMVIRSPDAVARVVGTRFTLRVDRERGTSLEVEEGEVLFRSLRGREVAVNPSTGPSFATIAKAGDLPPASPVAISPEATPPGSNPAVEDTQPSDPMVPSPSGPPPLDRPADRKPAIEAPPPDVPRDVDLPVSPSR